MNLFRLLFAIALPLVCATPSGTPRRQDLTSPSVWKLKKIAFESTGSGIGMAGPVKGTKSMWPIQGHISVMVAPDTNEALLAEGQAPSWSPDGEKLAFCTLELDGFGQIQVVDADGSGQTQLTNMKGGACLPDWSPDGGKIAFTYYDVKGPMIATIDTTGENVRIITDGYGPRWSPSGKQLLFYRDLNTKGTKRDIWVVNADGTAARKVIGENGLSQTWARGGQARFFDPNRIIFSSNRDHAWSIFRVNLDGTNLEKFAENAQFDLLDPVISPDGNQLVVQGVTSHLMSGNRARGEVVMLLLDLPNKQWTRLIYGTSPSVVWKKKSPYGTDFTK